MAATLLLAGALPGRADQGITLPDIGDPADTVLSRAEERQLGSIIAAQIRSSLNVLSDPELNSYVQSLGTRLVSAGANADLKYTFLIVADPAVNAFATPGGVVTIFTGLIDTAENESEVAGVMAHEIAHIEQRHMARAMAHARQINIATALGVLASIAAAVVVPGAGVAGMQSTLAAGQQAQLAFSRSNEQEADRVGIDLLTEAHFDPEGMPSFFERLQKATELSRGQIPELLMTHPVTLSRISDTKARADQYKATYPGPFVKDSEQFHFIKGRVLALTTKPNELIEHVQQQIRAGKKLKPAQKYAYAIALTRAGKAQQAIKILSTLHAEQDGKVMIQLALAQAYLRAGRPAQAQALLERLNDIYPGTEAVVYYLGQSLLDQGRTGEALALLERATSRPRHNPILDELKAKVANKADRPGISREAIADYYIAYAQYDSALLQLEMALRDEHMDAISRARIRAKHKELKDLLAEA